MTTNRVGVVVPVFGDTELWGRLAAKAAASVVGADVIIVEADTLAAARNLGATKLDNEYLMFLDADDSLDVQFFERCDEWTGQIVKPTVITNGTERKYPINDDIRNANYLIVGCPVQAKLFHKYTGFGEFPCYEDWELWARLIVRGEATVEERPESIYYYNLGHGRNVTQSAATMLNMKQHIRSIV